MKRNTCSEMLKSLPNLFSCSTDADATRISTPFTYPNGDVIDVFVQLVDTAFFVTDYGETIREIESGNGKELGSNSIKSIKSKCDDFGVRFIDGEICDFVPLGRDLSETVLRIINTMIRVAETGVNTSNTLSPMHDGIEKILIKHKIKYKENYLTKGVSGINRSVDFKVTNANRNDSLLFCVTTKTPGNRKAKTDSFVATLYDIKLNGIDDDYETLSVIDDTRFSWTKSQLSFMKSMSTKLILWSNSVELERHLIGTTGSRQ